MRSVSNRGKKKSLPTSFSCGNGEDGTRVFILEDRGNGKAMRKQSMLPILREEGKGLQSEDGGSGGSRPGLN